MLAILAGFSGCEGQAFFGEAIFEKAAGRKTIFAAS
jgi:hypothetical protein